MRSRDGGSDTALMRAFVSRDPVAAETLYDRLAPRVYGLGRVMLGNDAAAQDLVQDTFVKLWRSAERFDPARGALDPYALLLARGLAIDALRRRVLDSRIERSERPISEASDDRGPEESSVVADLARRARRAMEALSPEQRAAIELAYFGGKTSAEVAELEGIPIGTAKTRIRAALIKLREVLGEQHEV